MKNKKKREEWIKLNNLRSGAVFETKIGVMAVKSEYKYGNSPDSQWQCILLESGEYAHFSPPLFSPPGNNILVREVKYQALAQAKQKGREEVLEDVRTLILNLEYDSEFEEISEKLPKIDFELARYKSEKLEQLKNKS